MAASFWDSHCSKLLISKQRLEASHAEDKLLGLTAEHIEQLNAYFAASISELAKYCKLRQRVAATAIIYFKRVYLCNNFCRLDPRLVHVACLYLACKSEESLLAAKHLVACAKKQRSAWLYDVKDLLDMEMVLLEDLDFNLVVFSPYVDLLQFLTDARADTTCAQHAWGVLNDSLRSDVHLLHPPHIVALACLSVAAAAAKQPLGPWLQGLNVDLAHVSAVASEVAGVYRKHRMLISTEECSRLLDLLQSQRWDPTAVAMPFDKRR